MAGLSPAWRFGDRESLSREIKLLEPSRNSHRLRLWFWLITERHSGSSVFLPCLVETWSAPSKAHFCVLCSLPLQQNSVGTVPKTLVLPHDRKSQVCLWWSWGESNSRPKHFQFTSYDHKTLGQTSTGCTSRVASVCSLANEIMPPVLFGFIFPAPAFPFSGGPSRRFVERRLGLEPRRQGLQPGRTPCFASNIGGDAGLVRIFYQSQVMDVYTTQRQRPH